jgi:hypothetical protein
MAPRKRKNPRYKRQEIENERDQAEEALQAAEAEARSQQVFLHRLDKMSEAARQERWANVNPEMRLRIVKPFPEILIEAKVDLLGYGECVIEEPDDGRSHIMPGHPGCVKSQEDAEKLMDVLSQDFPEIRFRIELDDEYLVGNVIWKSIDEFLGDANK